MNRPADTFGCIGLGYSPRAPYACHPDKSPGRLIQEAESPTRTAFQRDRDRIIHSTAFRRLKHKTQVFVVHESDHYRTRLTHTIEVAQIARAITRALRGDEDLAEAIALAHDFGHTPFGHAGERALNNRLSRWGGFDHNLQTLRVVTQLEQRYAKFDGLNLTWESLEGLIKHNGPVGGDGAARVAAMIGQFASDGAGFDLNLSSYASLEAQVAAIADDIAYNSHDIDDGLRAGLLDLEMLKSVPFLARILAVIEAQYPDLGPTRTAHELMRRQITAMVEDVILEAQSRLDRLKPLSADAVRRAGAPAVAFSDTMARTEGELKAFLWQNLYRHEQVMRIMGDAETVVCDLFDAYAGDPTQMPDDWAAREPAADEAAAMRKVADFLAGMTDTFALGEHRRLFDDTPDLR